MGKRYYTNLSKNAGAIVQDDIRVFSKASDTQVSNLNETVAIVQVLANDYIKQFLYCAIVDDGQPQQNGKYKINEDKIETALSKFKSYVQL